MDAACCADESCVAVNYKLGAGSGDLCSSTDRVPIAPPPLDPVLAACFSPPQPDLYIASPDPNSAGAGYGTLDEAAKACLSSKTCGAVMLDALTATYTMHPAAEAPVEATAPPNQFTVWQVKQLCESIYLACAAEDGKYHFSKMAGKRS